MKEPIGEEFLQDYVRQAIVRKTVRLSADNLRVAIPMVNNRGTVLALLCAEKERGIFFEDIQLLEVYVQQTVATIENIILNERLIHYQELLGKQMDQFVMLHYIAQEINAAKDYFDLLERYLKTLCSPMGFTFSESSIYVIDGEGVQLARLEKNKLVVKRVPELEGELARRALAGRNTVLDETRCKLAMPLNLFGKINAVVVVENELPIQSDQVQVLETFAVQTSATLANTRLNMDLEYLSQHDPLTKLKNRFYFEKQIRRVETEQLFPAGLIICDVDGLKMVNDNLGHDAGDALLREAAKLIRTAVPDDVVARIGGDEFAVVTSFSGTEDVQAALQRIRDALLQYNREQPQLPVWISLGYAASEQPIGMAALIKEADRRMYEDKLAHGERRREDVMQAVRRLQAQNNE